MNTYKISIYASDHVFYEGDCEYVSVPTEIGMYGVMANHRNTITAIVPGKISLRKPNTNSIDLAVSSGFMKIEDNEVLILVDSCELPEEIDIQRAKRAEEEARRELKQKRSKIEYHMAQTELLRAINRLKIKK